MKCSLAVAVVAALFTAALYDGLGADIPLPPHPRLLLDSKGIVELKNRVAAAPWAGTEWADLVSAADRALGHEPELPPRGGNWSHNYVCPTHGARLSRGEKIKAWEWEHRCPVGNHMLRGDPSRATLDFDGNAISAEHSRLVEQAVDHGLIFQVTGDLRHASRGRRILLAYAERYLLYPMHDNQGRPGAGARVASQSLTEASWLIHFVQAADLVWSTLSETDRIEIRDKLLLPCINDVLLKRRGSIHNIQCRINSAIGLTGFLLGDRDLIARAIDDPIAGFRKQLEKGVLADGMWYEGSSGYHFFTIEGLWPLAEAARHCGMGLYTPAFKRMFDAPLMCAMPNLSLPDFNDSGSSSLTSRSPLYELAAARFDNPAYARLLAGSDRRNRMALLFGRISLPAAQKADLASRNFPDSGYAILQRGENQTAAWLGLKYGPHGGGHGHPDKNHFILFARDQVLAPDGGTHAYGSELHRTWDKATAAHNTLVVDGSSQQPAQGRSLAFGSLQGVDYSITDAGPIYSGVRFIRTVAMLSPDLFLFVDQVQAENASTFDLNYHQVGSWGKLPPGSPWSPPSAPGYSHMKNATVRPLDPRGLNLAIRVTEHWNTALILPGGEPTSIITGYGILRSTQDEVPWVVQRRHAQSTAFVWALGLNGQTARIVAKDAADTNGRTLARAEALQVEVRETNPSTDLLINPFQKDIAGWDGKEAFALRAKVPQ